MKVQTLSMDIGGSAIELGCKSNIDFMIGRTKAKLFSEATKTRPHFSLPKVII